MHPGEYRQRVGYSTVFKVVEEVLPSGQLSTSLVVEETDSDGYMKKKSLEFYFNGIIGHLRDRWGYPLDSGGYMKKKSLEFYFKRIIGHLRDRWGMMGLSIGLPYFMFSTGQLLAILVRSPN